MTTPGVDDRIDGGTDPVVTELLTAIRRLGDGPEPAPNDALATFLAERHARPVLTAVSSASAGQVSGSSGLVCRSTRPSPYRSAGTVNDVR